MKKITYSNKTNQTSIADRKKQVTAEDLNEIKEVVNYNAEALEKITQGFYRLGKNDIPLEKLELGGHIAIGKFPIKIFKSNAKITLGGDFYWDDKGSPWLHFSFLIRKANNELIHKINYWSGSVSRHKWEHIEVSKIIPEAIPEGATLFGWFDSELCYPKYTRNLFITIE